MANIKSAKKRAKVAQARSLRQKSALSAVRTKVKKFEAALLANNVEEAKITLAAAVQGLDQAHTKGLLHKNNVANKKSQLMKKYNKLVG